MYLKGLWRCWGITWKVLFTGFLALMVFLLSNHKLSFFFYSNLRILFPDFLLLCFISPLTAYLTFLSDFHQSSPLCLQTYLLCSIVLTIFLFLKPTTTISFVSYNHLLNSLAFPKLPLHTQPTLPTSCRPWRLTGFSFPPYKLKGQDHMPNLSLECSNLTHWTRNLLHTNLAVTLPNELQTILVQTFLSSLYLTIIYLLIHKATSFKS